MTDQASDPTLRPTGEAPEGFILVPINPTPQMLAKALPATDYTVMDGDARLIAEALFIIEGDLQPARVMRELAAQAAADMLRDYRALVKASQESPQ